MFRRKYRILFKGLKCKSSNVASNQMIYQTRWYNKRIFIKGYSVPRDFSWIENYKLTRRNKQHECHTSAAWKTRMRHEWKVLILITTGVKTFSHSYISHRANQRLQGEKQFHSRSTFWKCLVLMPKYVWKMHHKNWTL